jgi:hypothetical protein
MATLAQRVLEKKIEETDLAISSYRLRLQQQVVHLDELSRHPSEARKARATLDRWLGELSQLQEHRLNLYRQLAFMAVPKQKRLRVCPCRRKASADPCMQKKSHRSRFALHGQDATPKLSRRLPHEPPQPRARP